MGDEGNARWDEFWASGVDPEVGATLGAGKTELVIRPGKFLVFQLSLGDRSLERDVPQ